MKEVYRYNTKVLLDPVKMKQRIIQIIEKLEELDWDSEYKYQELEILDVFIHLPNGVVKRNQQLIMEELCKKKYKKVLFIPNDSRHWKRFVAEVEWY